LIPLSDGDRIINTYITPEDDEEFIATLFPHPFREQQTIAPPIDRPLLSANPYLSSEEDRSLFNHYIHVVSRALSRSHDNDRNPFLVTLLPLAAASDAVTSVILSLSGCHWRRVYPSIWGCALKRQGKGWLDTAVNTELKLMIFSTDAGESVTRSTRSSFYFRSMRDRIAVMSNRAL
jgi:hypothetical protein